MAVRIPSLLGARIGSSRLLSSGNGGGLAGQRGSGNCQVAPQLPACDIEPQKYQGRSQQELLTLRRRHLSPFAFTYYQRPLLLHHGHMQWVWDADGRRYLDFYGGVATVSVGHCHPKVTAAGREQLAHLWHTTNIYMHPGTGPYMERLCSTLPHPLQVVFLVNSGSEANDLAMLLARLHTGNHSFITLRGGYHGGTQAINGLNSISSWKFNAAAPFGCHPVMCPDVYRGLWGGSKCRDSPVQTTRSCDCHSDTGECQAREAYLSEFRELLLSAVPQRVAGFIAEPIQGVSGVVQYPRGFLSEVANIIRERGGLYISDEVQTGFGRLGSHFWGFQSHGVTPDIVTMAKSMGNGFPMGAVVTTADIAACMREARHFNTFGGGPLACAIGSAVLQVIDEEGLMEKAGDRGTDLMLQLSELRQEFEVVGDVRGKGLMVGLELVRSKESREPLPPADVHRIWEDCREMGLLLGIGGIYGQFFPRFSGHYYIWEIVCVFPSEDRSKVPFQLVCHFLVLHNKFTCFCLQGPNFGLN
ncbi:alanine--glyoxylate aminotransferase 2, mitochondrial isoform X2 [Hypanus sabinus]|uniref:alanine--glyoxylate aminotransferase 2, mitochondrial isoform X2 n=1 Tax=Hypanus sabinus TaxID=79690 RepID=UPI0028C4D7BD|nr:alanine--glyoxylate aminotransferase 2, mitochondrial isoform X2 [Hypanus sabinus]